MRVARQLADRALVIVKPVRGAGLRAPSKAGIVLAVRAATSVVARLEEVPLSATTPAQQLLLRAAAAQLRAAAGSILPSVDRDDPDSFEASLGELVSRTLALVEQAMVGRREIGSSPSAASEGRRGWVEVGRDGAVGERLLQTDAHQAVRPTRHALLR